MQHQRAFLNRGTAALLVFCAPLVACQRGNSDDIETRTPPPIDDDVLGNSFVPAQYWALKQVFTTLVVLPVLGTTQMAAQSASYYTLEWMEEDGVFIQRELSCLTEFNEVAGMITYLPDSFYSAVGEVERQVSVEEMEIGASYLAADHLSVYGADLQNPQYDALPTDPDEQGVIDFEADGNPGFTASVDGWLGYAESYMVQRTVTSMHGTVLAEDRIEGWIENTLEQNILDASTWWAGLDGFESVPSGNPDENFFIMVAVDGPMDCETLIDQREILFQ